jgi:N-acylneuraminate cytidylyltransferase/CMP-N,N'-diacetyllegionaminic acid synthase
MLLSQPQANAVMSVTDVSESPYWMKIYSRGGYLRNFVKESVKDLRRQDLPAVYVVNGAIYICKTAVLLKHKTFSPVNTLGYLMPRDRSIDIDDINDFILAEVMLKKAAKSGKKYEISSNKQYRL